VSPAAAGQSDDRRLARLEMAERNLAACHVELRDALARDDEHEARTCRAAIALLERQIAILRGGPPSAS
jgi:hypothetical protein